MMTRSGSGGSVFKDFCGWNPVVWQGVIMVIVWLLIVNAFAVIAFNRLNLTQDTAFEWMAGGVIKQPPQSWNIINIHNRWDSYWYLDIAEKGYYLRGENDIANVVFFPLYPMLMQAISPLTGGDLILSGWIVSSVFLILAVVMLIRLVQVFHPGIDPILPVMFLLVYPTAFKLNAVYSESLFLFLSLAMVYYARHQRFLIASVFAGLASATRVAGVFLCILLLVEFIQSRGFKALFSRQALPLALAPSGVFCFFLYHLVEFGDFFLYLKIQANWGRDFEFTARDFMLKNSPYLINMVNDIFFTALSIIIGILSFKRLRISYGVYILASLGVALSTGTLLGVGRYSMMLFPIYLMASSITSLTGKMTWLLTSTLLMALHIICYVNHYWVG